MSSVNGSSWLRQGQKVTCIAGPMTRSHLGEHGYGAEEQPLVGSVYTIRSVVSIDTAWAPCLLLEEIRNDYLEYSDGAGEFCFLSTRFRPVVAGQKEADAKMFKSIANEAEKPLVNLTDALNRAWLAYGVDE